MSKLDPTSETPRKTENRVVLLLNLCFTIFSFQKEFFQKQNLFRNTIGKLKELFIRFETQPDKDMLICINK